MKCPACGLVVPAPRANCRGCGFEIHGLDVRLGAVPPRGVPLWDAAGVLSADQRGALHARLDQAAAACRGVLALVLVPHTRPVTPAEYAFWLFNRWPVAPPPGQGLLVLLAIDERRIEVEVGAAWESRATEARTEAWLETHALPLLHAGRPAEAAIATMDAIAGALAADVVPEVKP